MARIQKQFTFRTVVYQLKLINCGKKQCKRCPHGPYWYAIIPIGAKKPAVRYIGKELHGDAREFFENNGSKVEVF